MNFTPSWPEKKHHSFHPFLLVRAVARVFLGCASQSSDLRTFPIPPRMAAFPSPPVFPSPFSDSGSITLFSTLETWCQSGDSALPALTVLATFRLLLGNPGPEGSPLHCKGQVLQDGVSLFSQGSLSLQVGLVLCVGTFLTHACAAQHSGTTCCLLLQNATKALD